MLERIPIDHLTGFFSRESLKEFLQENMLEAASERKNLLITLLDLDHFKNFNDKFGHVFGDEILKFAAEVLRSTVGETSSYFFRYGGDEFIIISTDKKASDITRALKKYNSRTYYQPFLFKNKSYKITMSAGVAVFPRDAQTVDELIRKADKAMYFSKAHGRKTVTLVSEIKFAIVGDVIFAISLLAAVGILAGFIFLNPVLISNTTNYLADKVKAVSKIKVTFKGRPLQIKKVLDSVVLKDGSSYEGRILVNGANEIIMKVNSDAGETLKSFSRANVTNVSYGSKK